MVTIGKRSCYVDVVLNERILSCFFFLFILFCYLRASLSTMLHEEQKSSPTSSPPKRLNVREQIDAINEFKNGIKEGRITNLHPMLKTGRISDGRISLKDIGGFQFDIGYVPIPFDITNRFKDIVNGEAPSLVINIDRRNFEPDATIDDVVAYCERILKEEGLVSLPLKLFNVHKVYCYESKEWETRTCVDKLKHVWEQDPETIEFDLYLFFDTGGACVEDSHAHESDDYFHV